MFDLEFPVTKQLLHNVCERHNIAFEFSFEYVYNLNQPPSFYLEWDPDFGDYIRFGFHNKSNEEISYNDNSNLILESGYISHFYSYDIYNDGDFGKEQKIYIQNVMFNS